LAEAVALANRTFKAQHPDVDVDVQYQSWGTHLTKFDAALAGGDAPDVIEMGNTEMTKYMAAGAFKTLTQSAFPNSKTWLRASRARASTTASSTASRITRARVPSSTARTSTRRPASSRTPKTWRSSWPTARS
jgi:hypothetical protein